MRARNMHQLLFSLGRFILLTGPQVLEGVIKNKWLNSFVHQKN